MKHMLKISILALVILALALPAALAEGIVISEREKAIRLADHALEEKYGITQLTQEYFDRNTEKTGDGTYAVTYTGTDFWGYVLGTYEAVVENNTVTGLTWSHDGEDTSGGLNAEAWGHEQILEMLRLNQETGDISLFEERVNEINKKHGFVPSRDDISDADLIRRETCSEEARDQSVLSIDQMNEIAKQAVIAVYGLSDTQTAYMEILSEPDEQAFWYIMYRDIPCLISCIGVGDNEAEPDVLPNGLLYTEKNGTYWICVNVQTGEVVEIFYSAGIGGNG